MAPQRRCDMIINCIITWMTSHCRTSSDNDLLGGLYDRYGPPVVECPTSLSCFHPHANFSLPVSHFSFPVPCQLVSTFRFQVPQLTVSFL